MYLNPAGSEAVAATMVVYSSAPYFSSVALTDAIVEPF